MEILLADGSDYLEVMKDALFTSGYNVHTARDGTHACEILASSDIDLIISDIRIPGFDGLKLHAFVRELERYRRTTFIFLSGSRDINEKTLQLDKKFDFFFDKTTPPDAIVKFVDKQVFGPYADNWI